MLKNIDSYIKEFKKDFKKLQKNQNNITYDLDYLFNEPTTSNNSINAIKEVREVFNELEIIFLVKKQRKLEKNFTNKKLSIIF